MQAVALIIQEGGMRNAFTAGFIEGAKLAPHYFSAVVASSSGAGLGAFFVANQIALAKRVFTDRLTRREVYSSWNILRRRRPYDIDYLVDQCCTDLNVGELTSSPTPLYAGVFRGRDAQTLFPRVEAHNYRYVLKATGALPLLGKPIVFPDCDEYYDGGIQGSKAMLFAYQELGVRHMVLLCNRPLDLPVRRRGSILSWLTFPRWPEARRVLRESDSGGFRSFIESCPRDLRLYVVAPLRKLPVGRLTRSAVRVELAYHLGVVEGLKHEERLREFRLSQ